jgi:glucan phosphoethanolaminetransferase (alkaline phosphatase superfamily)
VRLNANYCAATLLAVSLGLQIAVSVATVLSIPGYAGSGMLGWFTTLAWLVCAAGFAALGRWWPIAIMLALLWPIQAVQHWLLITHKAQLNSHTLTILLGSDSSEFGNVLRLAWGWIVVTLALMVSCVWSAWQLRAYPVLPRIARRQSLVTFVGGAGALWCIIWLSTPWETQSAWRDVVSLRARTFEPVWPWGLPIRLLAFHRERAQKQIWATQAKAFQFGASAPDAPRIVVLVIGESSAAHHWQLGGYARPTNPLLSQSDVIWLSNYAAPAVATADSVPIMLTRRLAASAWHEPSIVQAFKEAGYTTHWLSNQATAGVHDVQISGYAQESHTQNFINWASHETAGSYDRDLISPFAAALTQAQGKLFVVVHLMGSHYRYAERIPLGQNKFGLGKSNHRANAWATPSQSSEADDYDDSIVQTDAVLHELIEQLGQDKRPSVLLYASDHGQYLPDNTCDRRWHGHGGQDDVFASALGWLSPNPENAEKRLLLRQNSNKPLWGADLFDTVLDAGNVVVQNATPQNSWFRAAYLPRQRWSIVLGEFVDADAKAEGACRLFARSAAIPEIVLVQ